MSKTESRKRKRRSGSNQSNKASVKIKNNNNDYNVSYSQDQTEEKQINELLENLPKLAEHFNIHHKIGEGTFSWVYLGSLKRQDHLPDDERKWFAIKHLVPTAHPSRIEHELRCMQDIGGKDNVINVELCLRNMDTVVFVMPYIPHKKFSEYMSSMSVEEVREYMRALLVALRRVHAHNVIHRDVKPGNFLYDRENKRYCLVDFGLAQRVSRETERDLHTTHKNKGGSGSRGVCWCAGVGGVCAVCMSSPVAVAPRAGTCGFRPPEVLVKWGRQGGAVDVWGAGAVLGALLAGRSPLFRPPHRGGDLGALCELHDLLGTDRLRRAAATLGRAVVTSQWRPGHSLDSLCRSLRRDGVRFPPSAYGLCGLMLDPDPTTRITAHDALQHPFFTGQAD